MPIGVIPCQAILPIIALTTRGGNPEAKRIAERAAYIGISFNLVETSVRDVNAALKRIGWSCCDVIDRAAGRVLTK